MTTRPLTGRVAVVAGGTRGAGRGIAVELGRAGATVMVTGRTTRSTESDMARPETIEATAELVDAAGGVGVAIRVDHERPDEVQALADRIASEHARLDILVNDIWGGDRLTEWGTPFWQLDLAALDRLWQQAVRTHIITSQHLTPLMLKERSGLIVEITDGTGEHYRGSLGYDVVKTAVIRLAYAMASELRPHGIAALAVTPGFLRSEAMLELFGVTAETWRDAVTKDRHFAASETPRYIGRAVAALAADPDVARWSGHGLSTWQLAAEYGFEDVDGTRPDWGAHYEQHVAGQN